MLDIKTYTLKQVSEILSVTERTLFKYLKSGKLRGQKRDGKWHIAEENLKKFINGET